DHAVARFAIAALHAQALSKIGKLRRVAAMMSAELGRDPEASELAEELGMPVDAVERWEAAARSNASLDEPIGGEEGFSLAAGLRAALAVEHRFVGRG
ncbi:MAG: sigma-70 domain-containing protein, partial [Chthoniobacterales bacterium]